MSQVIDVLLSPTAWLFALGIFLARMVNHAVATLRVMFTFRQKRWLSWILGFIEALTYILLIGSVLSNINNPLNIIGYSAGFATGNVLGMAIEKRLAMGYTHFNIISRNHSTEIADALRDAGFGVTEIPARGRDSSFMVVDCGSGASNRTMWKTWCWRLTRKPSSQPRRLFPGAVESGDPKFLYNNGC